jgi:serine/threonine protein kinase
LSLLHKFPDKLLAEVLLPGACLHCEGLVFRDPQNHPITKNKFFVCLADFDASRQKVPIAICTSQEDCAQEDHFVELTGYPFFSKRTFVNLKFLQFLSFPHFKERCQAQAVGTVGYIRPEDVHRIIEETKVTPMPREQARREEWQAILLLIRDDMKIDLT